MSELSIWDLSNSDLSRRIDEIDSGEPVQMILAILQPMAGISVDEWSINSLHLATGVLDVLETPYVNLYQLVSRPLTYV